MVDLTKLSDADLQALHAGDLTKLSDAGLAMLHQSGGQPAAKPASVQAGETIGSIPRQIGLTARYGLEGLANAAQVVTEPIRYVTDRVTGSTGKTQPLGVMATKLADYIGLPSPQGADERVVGDAARLMAGAGGMAGGANALARVATTPLVKSAATALAQGPAQQAISAASAGLAGGSVREAGGGDGAQFIASLGAGAATPMVANKLASLASKGVNAIKTALTPQAVIDQQVDQQISMALKQVGVDWSGVSEKIKQGMRADVEKALSTGGTLDPKAAARLLQFKMVPGTKPTLGMLSQDPIQITREKNLAKVGANSMDIGQQELPNLESGNTTALLRSLDDAGASGAPDAYEAGRRGVNALQALVDRKQAGIDALYAGARDAGGRQVVLDGQGATRQINDQLVKDNVGKLPPEVDQIINDITTGKTPLTVDYQQQLVKNLYRKIKGTQDGDLKHGLGIVRRFLDAAEPVPNAPNPGNLPAVGGAVPPGAQAGQEAIDAFKAARGAHKAFMDQVESTPALKAVVDGIEPDQFVSRFITGKGATVSDVRAMADAAGSSPEALQAIKQHLVAHLKSAATGQASDINKFRADSFNNALNNIGERKLAVFFSPEEITKLKAVGNVSNYASAQPAGTAVNNSNSGALVAAKAMDMLDAIAGKMPLGIDTLIHGTIRGAHQRQVMNPGNALKALGSPTSQRGNPMLALPLVLSGQGSNDR
jgi:hypothetical protein